MGAGAQKLPKQDLCFPTGWKEIRECQKILTLLYLFPGLPTRQNSVGRRFLSLPWTLPKLLERVVLSTGEPQALAVPGAVPYTAGLS